MKIEFNINEIVRVKVTPAGWKRIEQSYNELYANYKKLIYPEFEIPPYENHYKADEEGYTEFQLWKFMAEFGPHIHMGQHEAFFDYNILIGRKTLI